MPSTFFFLLAPPPLSLMSSLFKLRKHFPGKEKLNEKYFSLGVYPKKRGASQVSYSAIENSGESEAEI